MRLVYLALGWASGLLLVSASLPQSSILWFGLVVMAFIAVWLMWPMRWRWGFLALFAFALGGYRATFLPQTSAVAAFNGTGGLTIVGQVIAEPDVRDTVTQLRLRVETVEQGGIVYDAPGNVLVRAPQTTDAQYGDTLRVTGRMDPPGVYDTFSYADFLARQNIFSILRDPAIETIETGGGFAPYRVLLRLKANTAANINRMLPEPEAGLLVGILLGNERGISPDLADDFAATGAAHIVAISGFNMVILAGVVMQLLDRPPLQGLPAGLIALAVIAIYTVFVGANAAVVRAAAMSSVLIIGQAIKRKTYVPASLGFVLIVMSAFNPRVLGSVSFQLSFFATLGLALFADPFSRAFENGLRRIFPHNVAQGVNAILTEPLIVTAAALITTLPLTTLYFSRVSLVQLIVNLLIVPVQATILISGILATLLLWVAPPLAQIVFWFNLILLRWSIFVVRRFADLPFAEVTFYADSTVITLFFCVVIGGAILQATQPNWAIQLGRFARSQVVFSTTVLIGIAMVVLGASVYTARPDGNLHLHMLDVGHSNAFLIQTPGGAQILVDGGRFPSRLLTDIGDRIPFNDRHIEMVVITQPDEFTYGALPAVLSRYSAGTVLTNGQPNESDAFVELQEVIAPFDTVAVTAGYRTELSDGTVLEVLAPQTQPELTDSLDDNALVLRIRYGGVSFLLTGDLSAIGQANLLEAGEYPLATVMQLPQHAGARSLDEAFLEQVQPQVFLLHNDRANRRGDPNPDTLALLDEAIPLYRTDEYGTVHLITDGERLWGLPEVQPRNEDEPEVVSR